MAMTGIDLNRAGTPLLEIVSEPDMRSPEEAVAYARKIHQLVRWIGISDGNMQEGSFRVDANISLRPKGQAGVRHPRRDQEHQLVSVPAKGHRVRDRAPADILEDGGRWCRRPACTTPDKDETRSMRSKEEANDYRYFPDPDLLPLEIDEAFIDAATADLPELPDAMRHRFMRAIRPDRLRRRAADREPRWPPTSRRSPPAAATPSSPPTGSTARWPRR
jgi:aspartyl-tRNA(Asn)/glutamyl-tRNA(Gln) amidotransferase subunit B